MLVGFKNQRNHFYVDEGCGEGVNDAMMRRVSIVKHADSKESSQFSLVLASKNRKNGKRGAKYNLL